MRGNALSSGPLAGQLAAPASVSSAVKGGGGDQGPESGGQPLQCDAPGLSVLLSAHVCDQDHYPCAAQNKNLSLTHEQRSQPSLEGARSQARETRRAAPGRWWRVSRWKPAYRHMWNGEEGTDVRGNQLRRAPHNRAPWPWAFWRWWMNDVPCAELVPLSCPHQPFRGPRHAPERPPHSRSTPGALH